MKIVMIDNYDSFTYNLYQLFSTVGAEVAVYRNDSITTEELQNIKPDAIVISPGPKDPSDSGISKEVVEDMGRAIPILGVCLGMQVINEVFGGRTVLAPRPVHGERDLIYHTGAGIFQSVPSPFLAARYHSLMVKISSKELDVLALNSENIVMAIRHKEYPITGIQFHPESFMTEYGETLAKNFIEQAYRYEKNFENKRYYSIERQVLEQR